MEAILALFIPFCAIWFFMHKFYIEKKLASKLEVDIKDLQQIIYRKIEESKEQQYDIEILITKYPDHAKRKDVVKKWTERFYKRDNFTMAPNPYKS